VVFGDFLNLQIGVSLSVQIETFVFYGDEQIGTDRKPDICFFAVVPEFDENILHKILRFLLGYGNQLLGIDTQTRVVIVKEEIESVLLPTFHLLV
jgi:hypothetical protein